eukprot:m.24158 g.24158  ORF g.24158 m.24158 type:complete len:555 (-) comp5624_c0_seq1:50-1714(-)
MATENTTIYQDVVCDVDVFGSTTDRLLYLIMGGLVFFMHVGFPMLEAGTVNSKAVANILFKNFASLVFAVLGWFVSGYAFAFGDEFHGGKNQILGSRSFFLSSLDPCELPFFFFQLAFASTVVTIMSGSLASRPTMVATAVSAFLMSALIYPFVVHWSWSKNGFLHNGTHGTGYKDFAGAGVVHVVGGVASLVACIVSGARSFRLSSKSFKNYQPHSTPLLALGVFTISVSFLFFNGGAAARMSNTTDGVLGAVGLAMTNTLIGAASGYVVVILVHRHKTKLWSVVRGGNGMLAGLIGIAACAGYIYPWAAVVIGAISALGYYFSSMLLMRLKIDDAVDATSVHAVGGALSVIVSPLFYADTGVFYARSQHSLDQWGWNVVGIIVIILWVAISSFIIFLVLKALNVLRVEDMSARQGVDGIFHEELGYTISSELIAHSRLPKTNTFFGNLYERSHHPTQSITPVPSQLMGGTHRPFSRQSDGSRSSFSSMGNNVNIESNSNLNNDVISLDNQAETMPSSYRSNSKPRSNPLNYNQGTLLGNTKKFINFSGKTVV